MVWISFQVMSVVVELLSKTGNTISSNVPYILIKGTIFLLIYIDYKFMMPMLLYWLQDLIIIMRIY